MSIQGQTVLAEKLRHYGTDATDNKGGARLHKAKSWYGGMNTTDNDYMPIDESEEYSLIEEREEEEEEESVNPDAERYIVPTSGHLFLAVKIHVNSLFIVNGHRHYTLRQFLKNM